MLPPGLADLCFVDAASGSDAALAARTASAAPGARVMLLGASRPGLTLALSAAGLDVVVVDSSRTALMRARDALGDGSGVLLLAADPRELEIPGGIDAALIPSAPWRAVLLDTDRRHVLRAIAHELRPGGQLLLDLERPPEPPGEWEPMASAREGVRWQRGALVPGTIDVATGGDEVMFSAFAPQEAVDEALGEGFDSPELTDPRTGESADPSSDVVWARLRTTRGRA